MLYEVQGDLVNDESYQIFCHQTNCKGVMGAGIALQIVDKYPNVAIRNRDYCRLNKPLGTFLPIRVSPSRICVNIYSQDGNGNYTDYKAMEHALNVLAERLNNSKIPADWKIGFPYRMGCGLAGGAWNQVYVLIRSFSEKVKQNVYVVHRTEREENDGKRFNPKVTLFEVGKVYRPDPCGRGKR